MGTIVTLTELAPRSYVVDVIEDGQRRREAMTVELQQLLKTRARRLWATERFGQGVCGQQAQYEVRE